MKNVYIVIIMLIAYDFLSAKYLYPLPDKPGLAANFGEYRSGHYHAGLDFKVYGKIGSPIFAIEDGYVTRIKTTPFGYGKVVYQKLIDGRIAVYAHNDKFNSQLEKIVFNEQKKQNKYSIERYFPENEVKIQKGEIIAYAGRKGTIHPHLHFELRDSDNCPVNPFHYGFKDYIIDHTPPVLAEILLVPLTAGSMINYDWEAKRMKGPDWNKISLIGNIGIEARFYDKADFFPNVLNVYEILVFLDDSLIYENKYDKICFKENNRIDYEYNRKMMNEKGVRFFRLYDFPFLNKGGIIRTNEIRQGYHEIKIILSDFYGNQTIKEFQFYSINQIEEFPGIIQKRTYSDTLYVFYKNREKFKVSFQFYYKNGQKNLTDYQLFFNKTDSNYVVKTPLAAIESCDYLKIDFFDNNGMLAARDSIFFYNGLISSLREKETNYQLYENFMIIEVKNRISMEDDFLILNNIKKINSFLDKNDKRVYFINYKDVEEFSLEKLEFFLNGEPILAENFDFYYVNNNSPLVITSSDSLCELSFKMNSFYGDKMILSQIKSDMERDEKMKWDLESQVYTFSPSFYLLKKKSRIKIRFPFDEKFFIGMIYQNRVSWLGNQYNDGCFQADISNLGSFAVVKDTVPPELRRITRLGKKNKIKNKIEFYCEDKASGLSEKGIFAQLNGQPVVLEWDGPKDRLIFWNHQSLKGENVLFLKIKDRLGNEISDSVKFIN